MPGESVLGCPLCSAEIRTGETLVCNHRHPSVRLSWQWPSVEEYRAWYSDPKAYHVDEQKAGGQDSFVKRDTDALIAATARLDWMESVLGHVRSPMLDIGTATGAFVAAANMRGIATSGIEPNEKLAALARRLGREVWGLSWEQLPYRDPGVVESLMVITAHDLLEHTPDPRGFLKRMSSWLADDGVLVIEMPEWTPDRPADWKHDRPKQHPILFSREAAEALYEECGFEVIAFLRPKRGSLGKMSHILQKRKN